jgi:hypothetical protein
MAEEHQGEIPNEIVEEQAVASPSDPDPYVWVADEPRTTRSRYAGLAERPPHLFSTIEDPGRDHWDIIIPGRGDRVCWQFERWGAFSMYQIAFEELGYRLPFNDFEIGVFDHLKLAPSQLHPNSLAFLRAFEIVSAYLQIVPTLDLFFHHFRIQRSKPKGDAEKHGWVSFTQRRRLFEMFEESVRGFKDNWYGVFPRGEEGLKTIVTRIPKVDASGEPMLRANGDPVIVERGRFPFRWKKNHYLLPANSFSRGVKELDSATLEDYKRMCDFVEGFVPLVRTDKDGNPVIDDQGNVLTAKRLIETKALLACSTRAEAEALLSMFNLFPMYCSFSLS